MSSVLDSSVLVAALTDSGRTGAWAIDRLSSGPVYTPGLAVVEAMNILRNLERARRIDKVEASAACDDLLRLELELLPLEPFSARVWELRHNLSAYDAWYVAAAEQLELPLATLDRRMSRATGPRCNFLLPR